ncbi:polysialyltransferase family glycosyltransferase [Acinetobacter johnsonii]|uniref:Alpha-2,8-polysialyltransferase family protein n=1 Tax=Acinetobacter johnsonii TaxID=40214 RepID=A0AAW6RT65_ACIJO|nr:polysialyltransferase family glycosyltransferase [Acinetobacter johnsonii]MDG9787051.1 alpha-2,8-polysialyltransferase family protein [Acinetobacter johnsonii]MDG9798493.1 alpha-2,8-polysialyltransferase family protein [Acinetobacter johnsonii]
MILVGYSVISQLHFLNFLTYFISNKERYTDCIVFIGIYWEKSIISQEYIDFAEKNNIAVVYEDKRSKIISEFKKNKKHVDIVFVDNFSIKIMVNSFTGLKINKIILIDEGVSSYASIEHKKKAIIREKGILWLYTRNIFYILSNNIVKIKKIDVVNFRIFHRDSLEVNNIYKTVFIDILRDIYSRRNFVWGYNDEKIAIFCSQPYCDLGLISIEQYKVKMLELKEIVNTKGMRLIVKKHPAESKFDYKSIGVEILNFTGAIEEFIANERVECLISKTSTSSLIVGSVMGVKSYVLSYSDAKDLGGALEQLYTKYCFEISSI